MCTSGDLLLVASAFSTLCRRLMITLLAQGFPLREIVGALLLDVGLCVCAVSAMELLRDRILDFDRGLDLFIKGWKCVPPRNLQISNHRRFAEERESLTIPLVV